MNVLVIGATGLIGSHVLRALRAAGCQAIGASRRRPAGERADHWVELDFGSMTREQNWLRPLAGVDAVINCVGIIREAREGDFDRLHRAAPVALFAACERLGVRRVVQVSALGSHPDAATGYWRSKGAAEVDLQARRLSATVVRPSLVYGDDGASSVMFRMLATLPVLMMPMAHGARVQPIHVDDLAAMVVRLVMEQGGVPRELALVGPRHRPRERHRQIHHQRRPPHCWTVRCATRQASPARISASSPPGRGARAWSRWRWRSCGWSRRMCPGSPGRMPRAWRGWARAGCRPAGRNRCCWRQA